MGIDTRTGELLSLEEQTKQVMEVLKAGHPVVPITQEQYEKVKGDHNRHVRRALARREVGAKLTRAHQRALREAGL